MNQDSQIFNKQKQYYYRAKSFWENRNKTNSIADYKVVKARTNNEWAAEAAYYIALDHFEKNDMEQTEAACFDFVKNYPSFATWLVRTYLLLADVYINQGNLFKAKATMQSILDNYTADDEWRQKAEEKYAEIEQMEANKSKIVEPDF